MVNCEYCISTPWKVCVSFFAVVLLYRVEPKTNVMIFQNGKVTEYLQQ